MPRSRRRVPRSRIGTSHAPEPSSRGPSGRAVLLVGAGAVLGALVLIVAAFALGLGFGGPGATLSPSLPPALPAGTYTSQVFRPAVTFTLPVGWWISSEAADYIGIQPVDSDQEGIHVFRDPSAMSQDPTCAAAAEPGVGKLSSDLATWIRARPGLVTSNPRLAEIGGLRGVELDISIAPGWTTSCPFANGLPTVPLFVSEAGGLRWIVAGSEQLRVSLLDIPGGGTVVVDLDAFDGSLMPELIARGTSIVQSFSFAEIAPSAAPPSASP